MNIEYIVLQKNIEKNVQLIGSQFSAFTIKISFKIFRVIKYAEEQVAYGINYFLKVSIGDGLFIHIRIHRRKNQNKYDFYALHEIIKHNNATCVFTEGKKMFLYDQFLQFIFILDEPLTYFNYQKYI